MHFEAFQVSRQAVRLWRDGWFVPGDDPLKVATSPAREPVVVAGRDVRLVENEFLLCAVPIRDHGGPLLQGFPVENRLTGQTRDELRSVLRARSHLPWHRRLADFHLLLFLAACGLDAPADVAALAAAVRDGGELAEGYVVLISSMAGLA